MIQDTSPRARRTGFLALALLPLLGACSTTGTEEASAPAAAPAAPRDPVVAFAAESGPGAVGSVLLADGRPAQLRLTRSYYAASGRECREVLVGAGLGQRVQLVCAGEGGNWNAARPLLPGAGTGRP